MRAVPVTSPLEDIPVDFLADPDGRWEYEQLALAAGFDEAWGQLLIGALTDPHCGFPAGSAVLVLTTADHRAIALIDCLASQHTFLPEQQPRDQLIGVQREQVAA